MLGGVILKHMSKKRLLWIIVIIIFIAGVIIVFSLEQNRVQQNRELGKAIYTIVEDKNNIEFNLKPLTDFSWDKAQLFGPYTTKELIEENLGVSYNGQTGGIEYREDIFLLVFLNDDKVVQYAILERQDGVDFIQEKADLTPYDDLIKIKRTY